jgi:hypothetical protein
VFALDVTTAPSGAVTPTVIDQFQGAEWDEVTDLAVRDKDIYIVGTSGGTANDRDDVLWPNLYLARRGTKTWDHTFAGADIRSPSVDVDVAGRVVVAGVSQQLLA